MRLHWSCRAGFTLVEAVVAMGVFAMGIAVLMPMVVGTVRGNSSAAVRSEAVAMAQEELERLRALPYDDPTFGAVSTPVSLGIFTRSWRLIDVPSLPGDGGDLRRILVTVGWNAPGRGTGSVSLVASRAR